MRQKSRMLSELGEIQSGKGVQYILNEAFRIMGNPMLLHNMEYELVAYPDGSDNDDPIWCEYVERMKMSDETLEFFKRECFIEAVASCDGVTFLLSDKLPYRRVFGQIYDKKGRPLINLVIVECKQPFDDDVGECIRELCALITRELGDNEHYQRYGQVWQETLIKALLEQRITDKALYAAHVANLYRQLKGNLFVAVADAAQFDPQLERLTYFRDLCQEAYPAHKYYIYEHYIVSLISSDEQQLDFNKDLSKMRFLLQENNIKVGVSEAFDNLYELRVYFDHALDALAQGVEARGKELFYLYG